MTLNEKCQKLPMISTQKVEWRKDGISFPVPIYSEQIYDFIKKFYEYELDDKNYRENKKIINLKNIEDLNKYEILTELTYIIRGERFCDGLIARNLENGKIENLLRHLKEFTEQDDYNSIHLQINMKLSNVNKNKKVKNLIKKLPNYFEKENNCGCVFNTLEELANKRDLVDKLFSLIRSWKSKKIVLENKEITINDYSKFVIKKINSDIDGKIFKPLNGLPYPWIKYSTFLSFAFEKTSQYYYCECEREAIENYIKLNGNFNDNENVIYKKNICHKCLQKKPEVQYCHQMYGTKFKQYYGWYIDQNYYKFGISIDHFPVKFLESIIPKELEETLVVTKKIQLKICVYDKYKSLIEKQFEYHREEILQYIDKYYDNIDISGLYCDYRKDFLIDLYCLGKVSPDPKCLSMYRIKDYYEKIKQIEEKNNLLRKELNYYMNILNQYVENYTREEFKYPKIGESWISETTLFNIIKNLYPNESIEKHYRPKWLDGLEIDIYLPNLKLGFEYQGIQHYQAISHWGGEEQLKKQQEHDNRKKVICEKLGVVLIPIHYEEDLTESNIKTIIKSYLD